MNKLSGSKKCFGAELEGKKIVGNSQRQLQEDEVKGTSRGNSRAQQSVSFAPMEVERKFTEDPSMEGYGDGLDSDGRREVGQKLTAQQRYRRLKAQAEGVVMEAAPAKSTGVWGKELEGECAPPISKLQRLVLDCVGDPLNDFSTDKFIAHRFSTTITRAKFIDQTAMIGAALEGEIDWEKMKRSFDRNQWGIFNTSADQYCATIIFLLQPVKVSIDGRSGTIPRVFITPGPRGHQKEKSMADIDESLEGKGLGELDFARKYLIQALPGPWESMVEFGNEICAWRGLPFDMGGALTGAVLRQSELYLESRIDSHPCMSLLRTVARNLEHRPQYVEVFISVYVPVGADLNVGQLLHLIPPAMDRYQLVGGWLLQLAPAFDYLIGLRARELIKTPTISRVIGLRRDLGADEILQGLQPLFGEAGFLTGTAFCYVERARFQQTLEGAHGVADALCLVPLVHSERLNITLMADHNLMAAVSGRALERTYTRFGDEDDQRQVYMGPFQVSRKGGTREDSEGFRAQRSASRAGNYSVTRQPSRNNPPSRGGESTTVTRGDEAASVGVSRTEVSALIRQTMEGAALEMVTRLRQTTEALADTRAEVAALQTAQAQSAATSHLILAQQEIHQQALQDANGEAVLVRSQMEEGNARREAHDALMARKLAELEEVQSMTDKMVTALTQSHRLFQAAATEGITELRSAQATPVRGSGWAGGPPPAVFSPQGASEDGDSPSGEQGRSSKKRNAHRTPSK